MTVATMNLYQRLAAVMAEVSYVQKKVEIRGSGGYRAVGRDDVVAEVRPALLRHGVVVNTSQVSPGSIELTGAKTSSGTPYTRFSALYATSFVNVDTPSECLTVQAEGHGIDTGDKGPGKAATYAEKQAIIKTLLLETGISEEGRNAGEDYDDAPQGKQAASDGEAIRAPQSKSAAAAAAQPAAAGAEAVVPASKGLLKQLKLTAEAKGVDEKVALNFAKGEGYSWDALPKSVCVALQTWVNKQPDLEPGSNG